MKYYLKLLSLRMNDLPQKRLQRLEIKLKAKPKTALEEMLYNIATITENPEYCWYVYTNSGDQELKDYALLKGNFLYYKQMPLH